MQGSLGDGIARVTSLRAIGLREVGGMNGLLPATIGELPYLKGLYLGFMNSTPGPIPPSITNLSRLEALWLVKTDLSGPIPEGIGRLRRLRILEIWENKRMEGPFPASVTSCHNLTRLDVHSNGLVGSLPYGLGSKMDSLQHLDVSRNNFSGPLPSSLGNAGNLISVHFQGNRLSGALPDTLSGWKSVMLLSLGNNNFSGTLEPLSDLTSLSALRVNNNSFEGHLPVGFRGLENLNRIMADSNRLVGLVDREHSGPGYESVRLLSLSFNRLSRAVDLSVFPNLEDAWLDHNLITRVTGSIPQLLRFLSMRDNLLTTLPEGFRSMPNLKKLHLTNNRISQWPKWGSTPKGVCYIDGHLEMGGWSWSGLLSALDPPDWGSLHELDVSNNPINLDVTEFLMPLKWQNNLVVLDASNCSLSGAMRCEAFFGFPLRVANQLTSMADSYFFLDSVFHYLGSISLRDNNITAIETFQAFPSRLYHVDMRNNSLRRVKRPDSRLFSSDYARFTDNPDLDVKQTSVCVSVTPIEKCNDLRRSSGAHQNFSWCPSLTASDDPHLTPLVPDPQGYVVRTLENGEERFECTEFCSVFNRLEGIGINCTKCPPDSYSNRQVGTQTCSQCPDDAGSDEGSPACYCRLGHQRGKEPCEPCTAGSIGVRKGGADGSRSAWICQDCLPGLNCSVPINYNASVLPGFFQLTVQLQSDRPSHNTTREVTTYGSGLTSLPIVMSCPLPSACKGTNKTDGLNICSEGHEGFVCSRCKAGFSRQTPQQPCAPCNPLWQIVLVNVLLVLATLMAIFILTALAERASSSLRAQVPSQLIKIGLSHITAVCGLAFLAFDESSVWGGQISSLLGGFFAWTGGVPQLRGVWESLLRPYVGDKCVLYRNAVWLALPLVWLTAVPIIASGFDRVRDAFKSRRRVGSNERASLATDTNIRALSAPPSVANGKTDTPAAHCPRQRSVTFQEDFRTESVTPPSCQHSLTEAHKSGRWRQWLDKRGTMMVVNLTFLYPTVTKSMLALLRCRPFPYVGSPTPIASGESVSLLPTDPMDDMRSRMDLDSHVLFGSAEHAPFLWVAVAGLLLWTLAPMVCGVAFLWRHRDRLQDPHTRRRVGFLYVGYRKNFHYWDFVLAMRRVLVLLIAQRATAQPRQQLLGWTVVASVCLALQFAVWPFDRSSMDILNRSELRGLLVWFVSLLVMQFVVMLPEGTSLVLTIGLVLVVILANLVHHILLAAQVCRYGLLQVGYRYTAITDRENAIARMMSGRVTGPLLSWLINREEEKRRISPKVFYDWSSAALSADGPPAASEGCHPCVGWPVHRAVTAMQLTSAAMQDAIERLKLTHVPSDLHEFLWSHAFLVQGLRQKRVEMRSRRRGHVVVHLPRPDDRTVTGLRHMRTSDLSNVFRSRRSSDVSIQSEAGKTSTDEPSEQPVPSEVSAGITLHDLQANLSYVVDELVTREQMHQLKRTADGSDLEKAATEVPTDPQQHTGGWRGLYEAFRKAKRALIDKGSPPDAIPEALVSLAPTVVETPCGDAADEVPMTGSVSPVSSTQSHLQSDPHTAALTPPCHHLMRVDWHRLSSDEEDSVALSVSAEAVYDAVAVCQHSSAAS
ncbi:unnamed protein product [Vitrella brassicaformis CCMP3155]|uniref:Tyrosine-protein kinase ephrin type A/B receptor-like domain-containing protein n=3 Tax=Vitrella brassicaformis TaxID=1169539 RepID=A0A0G4E9U8_VITBC|nr:unnamed protein product [Vitrella brassicaformis CCMP3155]|eukprot:CEL92214.1 unnamed protein product [Vitrella brassicaformis CCMP3155]